MIDTIKEWLKPTKIEQPSRWTCPKHGDGGPSIAFYGKDGKKLAACIRCICDAFPLTEIGKGVTMTAKTVASFLITPDGTVLQSYHVHDYKTYKDANGETYMIDGGCEYLRTSVNEEPAEYFTVTTDDTHAVQRKAFHWGTRGKDGNQPLEWKPLRALDTEHIEAILETQHHIPEHLRKLFSDELEYRKQVY